MGCELCKCSSIDILVGYSPGLVRDRMPRTEIKLVTRVVAKTDLYLKLCFFPNEQLISMSDLTAVSMRSIFCSYFSAKV